MQNLESMSHESLSDNRKIIIEFDDGSKAMIGLENSNLTQSNSNLSSRTGSVRAYWYTGILNYSYYTDYVRNTNAFDRISGVHSPSVSIIGGSYTNLKTRVGRYNETSTLKAYSHMSFDYSIITGGATINLYTHIFNDTSQAGHTLNQYK